MITTRSRRPRQGLGRWHLFVMTLLAKAGGIYYV